jgi:two-component system sensor histidine kinase DesK
VLGGGAVSVRDRAGRIAGIAFTGVWLAYLVGPVADLITRPHTTVDRAAGLAIIAAFAAIYLAVVPNWRAFPRYALPSLTALAALAAAACILFGGMGTASLWIFISSAAGLLVADRRWAVRVCLAVTACYAVFCYTGHVAMTDFLSNLLPVAFLGLAMIGLRRQIELTAELRRAREEVAQLAASQERLRLARDLHDLTGQSLSMITLKSELAARLLRRLPDGADRDRAIAQTQEVAAVSRQTLQDIREAVSGYRRPTLAVEVITARTALESAGIIVRDDADLTLASGTFDPEAEAALAWCLREGVTNVIRHSGARSCRLGLVRRGATLALQIRDDGTGTGGGGGAGIKAGTGTGGAHPADAGGIGLRGMSERLSAVGGHLEVRPADHGFCLVATVPAQRPARPAQRPASPAQCPARPVQPPANPAQHPASPDSTAPAPRAGANVTS